MTRIMITGGAGSLGRRLAEELLKRKDLEGRTTSDLSIVIFDNHENAVARMRSQLNDSRLRWFIGDIRDKERLIRAMENVDYVIHCAALKHVDLCEYNPWESLKTNVIGTQNCIEAALDSNVNKFLTISSDKSVMACSTYGRCKALGESLTLDANNYKGDRRTKFSIARPPNYLKSDGSVFDLWEFQKENKLPITVTSPDMYRYFMDFDEIVNFVLKALDVMEGGEIFVPSNAKRIKILDLAKAYAKGGKIEFIGLRRGERLEELLIDPMEMERAEKVNQMWVIK